MFFRITQMIQLLYNNSNFTLIEKGVQNQIHRHSYFHRYDVFHDNIPFEVHRHKSSVLYHLTGFHMLLIAF